MSVWTIVVAAGSGTRFGRRKQYETLGDQRVIDWSLEAARAVSDGLVLVVPPDQVSRREAGVDAVVPGGTTRSESVRAGLAAVPADAEVIVVHDGARPLAGVELFERTIATVEAGATAAIPGVTPASTIKRTEPAGDGTRTVAETYDRSTLIEVQTPQAFAAAALRRVHEPAPDATDDAALVEAAGHPVVVVEGHASNVKITEPHDLAIVRTLLAERAGA